MLRRSRGTISRFLFRFAPAIDKVSQAGYRAVVARLLVWQGVELRGAPLWVSSRAYFDPSVPGQISLGDRTVVSHYVRILTHDFSLDRAAEEVRGIRDDELEYVREAPVRIGNRVFLGLGATVLPGSEIGDGCIVAAGAVVAGRHDARGVLAGVPARRIMDIEDYLLRSESKFALQRRRR